MPHGSHGRSLGYGDLNRRLLARIDDQVGGPGDAMDQRVSRRLERPNRAPALQAKTPVMAAWHKGGPHQR